MNLFTLYAGRGDLEVLKAPEADAKICFEDMETLSNELRTYLAQRGSPESLDDKMLCVLAVRTTKFTEAFLLVARPGYYEAAATLCRALYEGYLWARWILSDPGNGQKYFATGKRKAQAKAKKLQERGALQDFAKAELLLAAQLDKVPTVKELIEALTKHDSMLAEYHDYVYDYLCDFSHGNAAGTIDAANKRVSMVPEPEHEQLLMIARIARGIVAHFAHMLQTWWAEGKVAAPVS